MEKSKKSKKSPYFIANILLLVVILFLLIGYLNKISGDGKNKNKIIQNDFFSTFEDKSKNANENSIAKDPNIVFKQGQYVPKP